MGRDLHQAVREACLWLPEAEEHLSHGSPNFRVRGKGFATYVVNQHGDGRVALWLAGSRTYAWLRCADARMTVIFWVGIDQQGLLVADERYYIPPQLGHHGWIGLDVSAGCDPDEALALALGSSTGISRSSGCCGACHPAAHPRMLQCSFAEE